MKVIKKIRFILSSLGFRALVIRIRRKLATSLMDLFSFIVDHYKLFSLLENYKDLSINKILKYEDIRDSKDSIDKEVISNFLFHRFDLLGSGWETNFYGKSCRGLEGEVYEPSLAPHFDFDGEWMIGRINKSHLDYSQDVWKAVDKDYQPIDWQLDFKSGYRWSEKTWYKSIKFGEKRGVDIKVPWELARMQHLPMLAKEFLSTKISFEEKEKLSYEFRNQVLDFIATNPLRYGVNWVCSMDVSIRSANLLLAYDIFCSQGYRFDSDFEYHFAKSIYSHGKHIFNNLEWNYGERGNHYLSNVCGLAFIGRYLNTTGESDYWLTFSVQELINEVHHQFYPDGTNFEGSTSYHLLTSEMVLYTTSLILGIDSKELFELKGKKRNIYSYLKPNYYAPLETYVLQEEKSDSKIESLFPAWYFRKLSLMADFLTNILKPDNTYPQIGDNDSGRFFKLNPSYKKINTLEAKRVYANLKNYNEINDDQDYYVEELLQCSYIACLAECILGDSKNFLDGKKIKANNSFDCLIVNSFLKNNLRKFRIKNSIRKELVTNSSNKKTLSNFLNNLHSIKKDVVITEYAIDGNFPDNLKIISYPDFGLYLFKSDLFYLLIRCWPGVTPFHLGHMHLDQLSIELVIKGVNKITDPGSYVYGPLLEKRWAYRSSNAHFNPFTDEDILDELKSDPFSSIMPKPMEVSYFGKEGFFVEYDYKNSKKYFCIKLEASRLSIISSIIDGKGLAQDNRIELSKGYGVALTESK